MFNVIKIQEKLKNLIGVRRPLDVDYTLLSNDFYDSFSGLYVDDVELFDFKLFVDNLPIEGKDPTTVNRAWSELISSSIANVVNQVFLKPDYIDRQVLFTKAFESNRFGDILNPNTYYGYEIEVSSKKDVAFNVSRVIVEAVGTGDFTIGLYASGVNVPLMTKVVTFPSHNLPFEVELNWMVDNSIVSTFPLLYDVTSYKGKYFLGIIASDTNVITPLSRDYENGNIMSNVSELNISSVTNKSVPTIFSDSESNSDHNGLNFDITVLYDYTDLVLNNKQLFAKSIQINTAISVLTMALKSIRSNRNQRVSAELYAQILLILNGNKQWNQQRVYGLKEQLVGEIAKIQQEVFKVETGYFGGDIMMDTVC